MFTSAGLSSNASESNKDLPTMSSHIDRRLNSIDQRLNDHDGRLASLESRVTSLDQHRYSTNKVDKRSKDKTRSDDEFIARINKLDAQIRFGIAINIAIGIARIVLLFTTN